MKKIVLLITILTLCACTASNPTENNQPFPPLAIQADTQDAQESGTEAKKTNPSQADRKEPPETKNPPEENAETEKTDTTHHLPPQKPADESAPPVSKAEVSSSIEPSKPAEPSKPTETKPVETPTSDSVTLRIICEGETILSVDSVALEEKQTVFDVLKQVTRDNKIHMDFSGNGASVYVKGIHNVYEFDGGPESGWMYTVNGVVSDVGCGSYVLKPGDVIEWLYTKNISPFV